VIYNPHVTNATGCWFSVVVTH